MQEEPQGDKPQGESSAEEDTAIEEGEAEEVLQEAELEKEVSDLKDQLLRSLAEQESTRRIAKRNVDQAWSYAVMSFATVHHNPQLRPRPVHPQHLLLHTPRIHPRPPPPAADLHVPLSRRNFSSSVLNPASIALAASTASYHASWDGGLGLARLLTEHCCTVQAAIMVRMDLGWVSSSSSG